MHVAFTRAPPPFLSSLPRLGVERIVQRIPKPSTTLCERRAVPDRTRHAPSPVVSTRRSRITCLAKRLTSPSILPPHPIHHPTTRCVSIERTRLPSSSLLFSSLLFSSLLFDSLRFSSIRFDSIRFDSIGMRKRDRFSAAFVTARNRVNL